MTADNARLSHDGAIRYVAELFGCSLSEAENYLIDGIRKGELRIVAILDDGQERYVTGQEALAYMGRRGWRTQL